MVRSKYPSNYISFGSSFEVRVKEIKIHLPGSSGIYHQELNALCPKWINSSDYVSINIGDQGLRNYHAVLVEARFETNNTWFVRVYQLVQINSGWTVATSKIN